MKVAAQPYLKIMLRDGGTRIINEAQIVSVDKTDNATVLEMSNGQRLEIIEPKFEDWLTDFAYRKN